MASPGTLPIFVHTLQGTFDDVAEILPDVGGGFNYNTWATSWATSWGGSWGSA